MSNRSQRLIARLMFEEAGPISPMSGSMSQSAMGGPETEVEFLTADDPSELQEDKPFSENDLKIAKRFVELVGGVDRARELLDKIDECEDCIGLVDDEGMEEHDSSEITKLAQMMPSMVDLPTAVKALDLSSLYNDGAGSGFR